MGQWTERDITIALTSIWNSKLPVDNRSIVLCNIMHTNDTSDFNRAFWNALVKAGEIARKKAKKDFNEKAWAAQGKKLLLIVKNLMYCSEKDFFERIYCNSAIIKQLCSKDIVGMTIKDGLFG